MRVVKAGVSNDWYVGKKLRCETCGCEAEMETGDISPFSIHLLPTVCDGPIALITQPCRTANCSGWLKGKFSEQEQHPQTLQQAVDKAAPDRAVQTAGPIRFRFLYKCRRCGLMATEYRLELLEAGALSAVWDAIQGRAKSDEPSMVEPHRCESGFGIADFIGCEPDSPA